MDTAVEIPEQAKRDLDSIKSELAKHESKLIVIEEKLISYFHLVNEVKSNVLLLTREQEHLVKILEFTSSETYKTMEIIKKHIIEEFENQLKQGYRVDRLIKAILFTGIILVISIFTFAFIFPDLLNFLKPVISIFKM